MKKEKEEKSVGVAFYNQVGMILIICGIISFGLMYFVSLLPQDYEKYNVPVFFGIWTSISILLCVLGLVPLVLGKYSKKFKKWADKDVYDYANHLIEKEKSRK